MQIDTWTDKGPKRAENQDNYWVSRLKVNKEEAVIACLCDGMGGLDDGSMISSYVVRRIRDSILDKDKIDLKELERVIESCNDDMFYYGKESGKQMGTTCTVLYMSKGWYRILHVGDSRCFRINDYNNDIEELTEAHNLYELLKSRNPLRLQAMSGPEVLKAQNTLTRCIGAERNVILDKYDGVYEDGDIFTVCSDGFWHTIDAEKRGFYNGKGKLKDYIEYCIEHGENDNITVIRVVA